MNEVKIAFKNYKLLKEGELNLNNGSIFFAQGPNNVGKTSFLNLIQAIMEVKDETVNPVTFGEKEGFSTGTIPGADGKLYQYRYDFNIDGKSKFQFIDPDNKVIKSVTEMRAIFNYTHFTMEEFFDWSKSVPGRKKQREIFMNLLSEKERLDILEIEEKINTTSGEFVLSRRSLNTEIDFLTKKINNSIVTAEEQKLFSQKDEVENKLIEITQERDKINEIITGSAATVEKITSLKTQIELITDQHNEFVKNNNKEVDDIDKEIEALKLKRAEKLELLNTTAKKHVTQKVEMTEKLQELEKSGGVTAEDLLEKQKNVELLNERIKKGEGVKDSIKLIETKINNLNYEKKELAEKEAKAKEFDEKINTLREKKKDIIKTSENIPLGWSLGDDCITINNIPFTETDLSKSQAIKAIAELMMRINKAPVMLMGDAEALGYDILDSLYDTAKEMGKIMIFAEHVRSAEELKLVCYDELEKPNKEKKDIF